VNAFARQRVERGGEDGGERLALAGLHLDDRAAVERDRRDDLHVEWPESQDAPRGLAHECEDRLAQLLTRHARPRAVAMLARPSSKDIVTASHELALEASDLGQRRVIRAQVGSTGEPCKRRDAAARRCDCGP
jgi:hypothetical protein